MPPQVQLSRYQSTPDEVKQLRRMCQQWHQTDDFWTFDQTLATLHHGRGRLYYLVTDARWVSALLTTQAADSADICYIYVPVEDRGAGFGKIALRLLLDELFNHEGLSEVNLEVKPGNSYAIQIYRAVGFVEIGIRPKYYRDGSDAMVMKCSKKILS